jgi:CHAT domain
VTAADPLPRLIGGGGPTKPPVQRAARPPDEPVPEVDAFAADVELTGLQATWQDLREKLPEKVALLKVIPHKRHDGADCFQLEMYSHRRFHTAKDRAALERQGRPGLVLAEKLVRDVDPATAVDCYDELLDWSNTKPELTSWLTELRKDIGDDLRLIVWDDTDFGISWELFWHDMDESPAWLGTVAEIVRWVTVRTPGRDRQFSAHKCDTAGGSILYYEDSALVQTANHSIRDSTGPDSYIDGMTMKGLLSKLEDEANADRYGLVYIRGHGKHSNLRKEATLADVSLLKISGLQLRALRGSRALVFLNACNSARQVPDSGPGDSTNRNFAEVFLRRHATGVVATLAEVGAAYSASLPRKLVIQARAGGVRIPEFLRTERAKEAQGLPKNTLGLSADEQQKIISFLRVSMFAYFGHPETVFKLAAP